MLRQLCCLQPDAVTGAPVADLALMRLAHTAPRPFSASCFLPFSIARAFLKNAPIILLDEATASLDVENETLIQTALSRLIADKTVLVIAHRMRTVAGAGKIVVLSEGSVAEEGAPETLLKQNGLYARMVKLQTESQNWKLA